MNMFKLIRRKITNEADFEEFEKEVDRMTGLGFSIVGGVCNIGSSVCIGVEKKTRTIKQVAADIPDALERCKNARNEIDSIGGLPGFRKVTKITDTMKKSWNNLIEEFKDISLVEDSISNYINEIESRKPREGGTYHLHRFTFEEFLSQKNGARKFINY